MARLLLPLALLALAAALAPRWWLPTEASAPAVAGGAAADAPSAPEAVATAGAVMPPAAADRPAPAGLLLPDGTSVPALNGAVAPPPLARALGNRAFAPIVGIERSTAGIDWYVHADGVRSTTEMRWRADLGRYDALTRLALPVAGEPPAAAR
jgi:hypothetical protein